MDDLNPSPTNDEHPDKHAVRRWIVVPALLLVLAAIALFTVDLPVARVCAPRDFNDEVHRYLRTVEAFGTIYGQGMLMLGVFFVLPSLRRRIPRVLVAPIVAGLAANVIKLMVGRQRPKYFDVSSASATDAFERFFPFLHEGASLKSFPSAHTASAVAFAVLMSHLFPRGKWLFGVTAALVAVQRLEVCEHFVSDVLVGATVGWLIGQAYLRSTPMAAWFGRFESKGGVSSGPTDVLDVDVTPDRRAAA